MIQLNCNDMYFRFERSVCFPVVHQVSPKMLNAHASKAAEQPRPCLNTILKTSNCFAIVMCTGTGHNVLKQQYMPICLLCEITLC